MPKVCLYCQEKPVPEDSFSGRCKDCQLDKGPVQQKTVQHSKKIQALRLYKKEKSIVRVQVVLEETDCQKLDLVIKKAIEDWARSVGREIEWCDEVFSV